MANAHPIPPPSSSLKLELGEGASDDVELRSNEASASPRRSPRLSGSGEIPPIPRKLAPVPVKAPSGWGVVFYSLAAIFLVWLVYPLIPPQTQTLITHAARPVHALIRRAGWDLYPGTGMAMQLTVSEVGKLSISLIVIFLGLVLRGMCGGVRGQSGPRGPPRRASVVPQGPVRTLSLAVGGAGCSKTSQVEVSGSWDNWMVRIPMHYQPATERFAARFHALIPQSIPVVKGQKYHYKFIVDGDWRTASGARPELGEQSFPVESDERGNVNHVLVP